VAAITPSCGQEFTALDPDRTVFGLIEAARAPMRPEREPVGELPRKG
jgi:hypothetical protein